MPIIKRRKDDNGNGDYKNRALFDIKTIVLIISFLGGGAGINFATNGMDNKIEILESKFNSYCESQKNQDKLKTKMIEDKFNQIKDELKEIKEMIKDLK